MSEQQGNVWVVHVGEKGYKLPSINSQNGPFPPEPSTEGYIAVGWPAVGDMNLYKNGYADYISKFFKVYKDNNTQQANALWNFAFEIKENDWVISPSAATGYLLIGKIVGSYIPNFHNDDLGFHNTIGEVYLHLRKVEWLYVIPKKDERYSKLNKYSSLTVTQSSFSIDELKSILNTNACNSWSDTLIEETRNILDGGFVPRDDFVYMKNINGNYGTILVTDWMNKKWLIQDKENDTEYLYTTIDELIAAGWAVD